jgi:hypothetical protein
MERVSRHAWYRIAVFILDAIGIDANVGVVRAQNANSRPIAPL